MITTSGPDAESETQRTPFALAVAALGVVFGDIGTSPLYALRACFTNVTGMQVDEASVLGVLSLIFWSLALVIAVKYLWIILRADNKGEGGVLALMTLVLGERPYHRPAAIAILGLVGCALFYGDGVITPAVTVLGAIEGLSIALPGFSHWVVPLSVGALVWLFALQRHGTGAIGRLFGPVMILWFATLAVLGTISILEQPIVLEAINPLRAVMFFVDHTGVAFAVSGAVFLAVTGGEALYADLGHFGRAPIARAWFFWVWPCLVLNYFGQGALLLRDSQAIVNPFYLLAPGWLLIPLVGLATGAGIIASQAVISGVFAITQQCQRLGYLPRWRIVHSSAHAAGQVYVPVINWMLCIATIGLTIGFGSSERLTGAYGVGVAGTMLVDTLLMLLLLNGRGDRTARVQFAVMSALILIDLMFVLSNLGKVPTGGWFPLVFGLLIFGLMRTWQLGREVVTEKMRREEVGEAKFLAQIQRHPPLRAPGTAVYLTSNIKGIPRTLMRNLKINGVLHERTIIFTLTTEPIPRVLTGGRVQVKPLGEEIYRVQAFVGFMEEANVPQSLRDAERAGLGFRTDEVFYFLAHDDIVVGTPRGMSPFRKKIFLFLARNSQYAAESFGIPPSRIMEVGGQVVI
jgi:KUP system potassium uptake protein